MPSDSTVRARVRATWGLAAIGRVGTRSSTVSRKITFRWPQWSAGVRPVCDHSQPRKVTSSGSEGSPARALHWRTASLVLVQFSAERLSAWSLIDQKSSAAQWRAKSQASSGRVHALAPEERKAPLKGVRGVRRVDVEVAEENLLLGGNARGHRLGGDG